MTYPHENAAPDGREAVPGSRDPVPGTRPMDEIDPARTPQDDLSALRDRIAQLEKEAEARDAAERRAKALETEGVAPGGEPVEHFHRLADGSVVRGFGTATHIASGDKPPMAVVESYVVPFGYDEHYGNVRREDQ